MLALWCTDCTQVFRSALDVYQFGAVRKRGFLTIAWHAGALGPLGIPGGAEVAVVHPFGGYYMYMKAAILSLKILFTVPAGLQEGENIILNKDLSLVTGKYIVDKSGI